MYYKNFKTVTYCVAGWVNHITEEELREQADFLQKYVGIDKIYLETYRDEFAKKEQLDMFKRVMKDYGIEVSGGITTVTPDLNESDKKRQRLLIPSVTATGLSGAALRKSANILQVSLMSLL